MPSVATSAADWKLNENLGVAEPRYELLDVQLKSAHREGDWENRTSRQNRIVFARRTLPLNAASVTLTKERY